MAYKIGYVARIAKISVRTLHYYDEIGLITPSDRSQAGYRLYTDRDLERLQQVIFFRELGFPLDEISALLADPGFDRRAALIAQRARLAQNAAKAEALVRLIDQTIARIDVGASASPEQLFGDFEPMQFETEVEARWGTTASYAESKRRTKRYRPEDWRAIRDEADAITSRFATALKGLLAADDPRAMDLAESHRMHIDRWFYPCPVSMHLTLGEMYVGDARFAAHYDAHCAGLAEYVRDAIRANAERADAG